MIRTVRLIWCQDGNPASARLAVRDGWWYGFRSDGTHHADELGPTALLDCHWIDPDWKKHLRVAAEVSPWIAAVPDTMVLDEVQRTIDQGNEIAPHCDKVMVIPKCDGVIERLPREIGGKPVVLGYSIPTAYGGTTVPASDFSGWPVHLLGGNTRRQIECFRSMPGAISADGNLAWRLARRGIVVTEGGYAGKTIKQEDGRRWPHGNAHLEALYRSLGNIRPLWAKYATIDYCPRRGQP
jgi:hypothetical protein